MEVRRKSPTVESASGSGCDPVLVRVTLSRSRDSPVTRTGVVKLSEFRESARLGFVPAEEPGAVTSVCPLRVIASPLSRASVVLSVAGTRGC